jgi:hypothetical protein
MKGGEQSVVLGSLIGICGGASAGKLRQYGIAVLPCIIFLCLLAELGAKNMSSTLIGTDGSCGSQNGSNTAYKKAQNQE